MKINYQLILSSRKKGQSKQNYELICSTTNIKEMDDFTSQFDIDSIKTKYAIPYISFKSYEEYQEYISSLNITLNHSTKSGFISMEVMYLEEKEEFEKYLTKDNIRMDIRYIYYEYLKEHPEKISKSIKYIMRRLKEKGHPNDLKTAVFIYFKDNYKNTRDAYFELKENGYILSKTDIKERKRTRDE